MTRPYLEEMMRLTIAAMIAFPLFAFCGFAFLRAPDDWLTCLCGGLHCGAEAILTVYLVTAMFRELGWPWRAFVWLIPVFIVAELIFSAFLYLKAPSPPAVWTGIGILAGTLIPLTFEWLFSQVRR